MAGAFSVLFAVTALLTLLRGHLSLGVMLAVVTVVVAAAGYLGGVVVAVAGALLGWTFVDGFLLDRLGDLHWHGTPDARRLFVLLVAATVAAGVGWRRPS